MSVEKSRSRVTNDTDSRRQMMQEILFSMSPDDAQKGDVTRLLMDGLQAYNYSLSRSEVAFIDNMFKPIDLGPKREPLSTVIPITMVYSVIFVTGIIGNVCTCLVIIRNKYMRTVTNYYLFNLSISDLSLLLFGLPHETYSTWSAYPFLFGSTFCRLKIVSSEASSYVSILTITAFTVERYVAICHPITFPVHPGLSRPLRVMTLVWAVSTVCAIPVGLQFGIVYKEWMGRPIPDSAQCNTLNPDIAKIVFQLSTFVFFVLPMSVISLLYFLIALAVRKSSLNRVGSDSSTDVSYNHSGCDVRFGSGSMHQTRVRQSVLKMLVAVVVAFFLCWAPFHTQRLLAVYEEEWSHLSITVHNVLFYVSGVTYYFSATINPVLYSILSLKFRQSFRSTLLCFCCWARNQPRRRINRNSYTFKFHQRNQIKTHCSLVNSSNSNISINNSTKKDKDACNQSSARSCCGIVSGNISKHHQEHQKVELLADQTLLGNNSYENNYVCETNCNNKMI